MPLTASDTLSVQMTQLNHYYNIYGRNNLSLNTAAYGISSILSDRSNIYQQSPGVLRTKTENQLELTLSKPLFQLVSGGLKGQYYSLFDEQSSYQNNYDNQSVSLYLSPLMLRGLSLNTGYFRENRLNIDDSGLLSELDYIAEKEAVFNPSLHWNLYQSEARQNYKFNNEMVIHARLPQNIRNLSKIVFTEYHREYYVNKLADTESRRITNRQIDNRLTYPFSRHLSVNYSLHYQSERDRLTQSPDSIAINRIRDHIKFVNQIDISRKFSAARLFGGASFEQQQNHSSSNDPGITLPADYQLGHRNFSAGISFYPSAADSLQLLCKVSHLQLDTPDSNNYDDRDEVKYTVTPRWFTRKNKFLTIRWSGQMYYHHLIYLSRKKSAQNRWNRVFSLENQTILHLPLRIRWQTKQSVYANYFVYDFGDSSFVQTQDMVYRGVWTEQSIQYYWKHHWGNDLSFSLRLEDDGTLDWNNWRQDPIHSRYQLRSQFLFFYQNKRLMLRTGPTYSERIDYQFDPDNHRQLATALFRRGIYLSAEWQPRLRFSYHLDAINQSGQALRYNQNGMMNLIWIF